MEVIMRIHLNVMAALVIGDPADPHGENSSAAWQRFKEQLKALKEIGVHAIFFDVWWGLVEKHERQYDWRYYDKLFQTIIEAGLMAVPNMSTHQCGGNIGDDAYIPLPSWIWSKLAAKVASGNVNAVKYVSEQGNASEEVISCWAVDLVLPDYIALFTEFQKHFADKAQHIAEVTLSLGPAGELRFPSYNAHDKNAGFPTRGALQCYSELARQSWENWALASYGDREKLRIAWGELDKIEPPVDCNAFFRDQQHINRQYGRDLFDWYQKSLLDAGRKVMDAAIAVFNAEGAAFAGIDIGAKVPGVHWGMGHRDGQTLIAGPRLAELAAGVIRTSDSSGWFTEGEGHGYRPIVGLFRSLQSGHENLRIILHFTCLEKADGEDADMGAESLAATLVAWVGEEAAHQGVAIKGENALGFNLPKPKSWVMMRKALKVSVNNGRYEGLTLLRIGELTGSKVAMSKLKAMINWVNRCTCRLDRKAAHNNGDGKAA